MKRLWRRTGLVVGLVMILGILSACGAKPAGQTGGQVGTDPKAAPVAGQPKQGGTLRVATTADATNMDLHKSAVLADRIPLLHVQETLVAAGEDMAAVPMLAEKWEVSADGKLYTFFLRKDVKFHNGKEFTAEDVKYSLDRFIEVAPRKGEFKSVQEIKAVAPDKVEVVLKQPDAAFLGTLANPFNPAVIMPKGMVEEQGGAVKNPIGTGPFEFVEWVPDRHLKLKRFDGYKSLEAPASGFGGKKVAYLDEIIFQPITEAQVRESALQAGDIDFAAAIPPNNYKRLQGDASVTVLMTPSLSWGYIGFGLKKAPMDNQKLRQAVLYGLDKDELTEAATYGLGQPATSPIFPGWAFNTDVQKQGVQKDVNKAKQLIQESGYNGEEIVITASKAYENHEKTAITLESQLKALGLNAKTEWLEWAAWGSTRWTTGNYNIIITHITPRPDPHHVFYAYTHSGSNYFGYNSQAMDEALTRGAEKVNLEDRKKAYDDVTKLMREEVPYISTYWLPVVEGHTKKVQGYQVWAADYLRFWNVWLDK